MFDAFAQTPTQAQGPHCSCRRTPELEQGMVESSTC